MRDKKNNPKSEEPVNKPAQIVEKVSDLKEIPPPKQNEIIAKPEPPPPAPKPTKPSVEKETSAANKSAEIEGLIAVIDGQVLDFGASVFAEQAKDEVIVNGDHTEDLPVPPAEMTDLDPLPEPTVDDASADTLPPPPTELSNIDTLPAPPAESSKPITSALHPEVPKQNEVVESSPAVDELPPPPEEIKDDNINGTSQVEDPVAKLEQSETAEDESSAPPAVAVENTEQDEDSGLFQGTDNIQPDVTESESTNQPESQEQVNSESNDPIKDVQVSISETPVPIPPSTPQERFSSASDATIDISDYEWKPKSQEPELITRYMDALPKEKRPVEGTAGAKYRKKQLMRQLPTHDQDPSECHDLTPEETEEMKLFVEQYREKALGEGHIEETDIRRCCANCDKQKNVGDIVVKTDREDFDRIWCPECFQCCECKELLVDLIYFYHDSKIYCGRHYCELLKPRCAACDELIFAKEYTQAEECFWHLKHFCCWHCDEPLGGKNYVPHDNQPVCISCYEKTFANICATCKQIIAPNTEWVTFEDYHWHATDDCFKCSNCSVSLVGKPCIPKGEFVFCSSKCKREKLSAS